MKIIKTCLLLLVVFLVCSPIHNLYTPSNCDLGSSIIQKTQALIPLSIQMVDNAIEVLDQGYGNLSPAEKQLFNDIFDPGNTGTIDQTYIDDVLQNYTRIRRRLEKGVQIEYAANSKTCQGMRLYYTNIFKIYVCPYFLEEDYLDRKALTLIHEVGHMELLVVDRSYYDPKSYSARYHALIPRGPAYTEIPLIGHIIREIQRSDTLYHPDTYAWFAGLVEVNTIYLESN